MFMLFKAKDLLLCNEIEFSLKDHFTVSSQNVLAVLSVKEPYQCHDWGRLGPSPCRHCNVQEQNHGTSPGEHAPSWQEGLCCPFIPWSSLRWPLVPSVQGLDVVHEQRTSVQPGVRAWHRSCPTFLSVLSICGLLCRLMGVALSSVAFK